MHISRAKRIASARKAARTRARNKVKRRAAARRAAPQFGCSLGAQARSGFSSNR